MVRGVRHAKGIVLIYSIYFSLFITYLYYTFSRRVSRQNRYYLCYIYCTYARVYPPYGNVVNIWYTWPYIRVCTHLLGPEITDRFIRGAGNDIYNINRDHVDAVFCSVRRITCNFRNPITAAHACITYYINTVSTYILHYQLYNTILWVWEYGL